MDDKKESNESDKGTHEADSRIPGLSDIVEATAGRALDVPKEMTNTADGYGSSEDDEADESSEKDDAR